MTGGRLAGLLILRRCGASIHASSPLKPSERGMAAARASGR
jgi:hypothetical protein